MKFEQAPEQKIEQQETPEISFEKNMAGLEEKLDMNEGEMKQSYEEIIDNVDDIEKEGFEHLKKWRDENKLSISDGELMQEVKFGKQKGELETEKEEEPDKTEKPPRKGIISSGGADPDAW